MMIVNLGEENHLEMVTTVISTIATITITYNIITKEKSETEIEDHPTDDTNDEGSQRHPEQYFIVQLTHVVCLGTTNT